MKYKNYNKIIQINKNKIIDKLDLNFLNKSHDFILNLNNLPTNEREKKINLKIKKIKNNKFFTNNFMNKTLKSKNNEIKTDNFFKRYNFDKKIKNKYKDFNYVVDINNQINNLIEYLNNIKNLNNLNNLNFKFKNNKENKNKIKNNNLLKNTDLLYSNFFNIINEEKENVFHNQKLYIYIYNIYNDTINKFYSKNKKLYYIFNDFLLINNISTYFKIKNIYNLFSNKINESNYIYENKLKYFTNKIVKLKQKNKNLKLNFEENISLRKELKEIKLHYDSKISELIDHSKKLEISFKKNEFSYSILSDKIFDYKDHLLEAKDIINKFNFSGNNFKLENIKHYINFVLNDINNINFLEEKKIFNKKKKFFNYGVLKYKISNLNKMKKNLYLDKITQVNFKKDTLNQYTQHDIIMISKQTGNEKLYLEKKTSVDIKILPMLNFNSSDLLIHKSSRNIKKKFENITSLNNVSSAKNFFQVQKDEKIENELFEKEWSNSVLVSNYNLSIYNNNDINTCKKLDKLNNNSIILIKKSIKKVSYYNDEDQNFFKFNKLNRQEIEIFRKIYFQKKMIYQNGKTSKNFFNLIYYFTFYYQTLFNLKTKNSFLKSLKLLKNRNNILLVKINYIINDVWFEKNIFYNNNKLKENECKNIYNNLFFKNNNDKILLKDLNNNFKFLDNIYLIIKSKFSLNKLNIKKFYDQIIYISNYDSIKNNKISNLNYLINFDNFCLKDSFKMIYFKIIKIFYKLSDNKSNLLKESKLFLNDYKIFFKKIYKFLKKNTLFEYNILNKIHYLKISNWYDELKTKSFNINKFNNKLFYEIKHNIYVNIKLLFIILSNKNFINYENLSLIFIFMKEKELIKLIQKNYFNKKLNFYDFSNFIELYKIDINYIVFKINDKNKYEFGLYSFDMLQIIYDDYFYKKLKKMIENEKIKYKNYLNFINSNINRINQELYLKDKIWLRFKNIENLIYKINVNK